MKSRKTLNVVLDLDNTLISSHLSDKRGKPDFKIKVSGETYFVYKRPQLDEFIAELFDSTKSVSIWTAATKVYCDQIIKNISWVTPG